MLLNLIQPNIIPVRVSCNKQQSRNPAISAYQSDVLCLQQKVNKQVSFTSAIQVLERLEKHRPVEGISVLVAKHDLVSKIILFDEAKKFGETITFLKEKILEIKKTDYGNNIPGYNAGSLWTRGLDTYKEAIEQDKLKGLKDVQIKGIVGQGGYSTAFLTSDNKVIKLSTNPIFPKPEDMIEGVDVPIEERYMAEVSPYNYVYGLKEQFLEVACLRKNFLFDDFCKVEKLFNKKLKAHNKQHGLIAAIKYFIAKIQGKAKEYKLAFDFGSHQIGIAEDGKIYLLDHQCIENRPLVSQSTT